MKAGPHSFVFGIGSESEWFGSDENYVFLIGSTDPDINYKVGINLANPEYSLDLPNDENLGAMRAKHYLDYSDARVKKNQRPIPYGLEEVLKMKPKIYDHYSSRWDGNKLVLIRPTRDIGLIAQELYDIVPEAVQKPKSPHDLWSIKYDSIIPILVKSLQELHEKEVKLEEENRKLVGKYVLKYGWDENIASLLQEVDGI